MKTKKMKFNLILISLMLISFLTSAFLCFNIYASVPEPDTISLTSGTYIYSKDTSLFEVEEQQEIAIMPGQSDSFSFTLKNPTEQSLFYYLKLDAMFSYLDDNLQLSLSEEYNPIVIKMKNYSGEYVVGDETTYEPIKNLRDVVDEVSLNSKQNAIYTIEYCWPYESGNDTLDTRLGDLACVSPLNLNLNISALIAQELIPAKPSTSILPIVFIIMGLGLLTISAFIIIKTSEAEIKLYVGDKVVYDGKFKKLLENIPKELLDNAWYVDKEFKCAVKIENLKENPKNLYSKPKRTTIRKTNNGK